MRRSCAALVLVLVLVMVMVMVMVMVVRAVSGASHAPSRGSVWPRPREQRLDHVYYKYDPDHFNVTVVEHTCGIVSRAVQRYTFIVRDMHRLAARVNGHAKRRAGPSASLGGRLQQLRVSLALPCEERPYYSMDENYNLTVSLVSELRSASVWGILRGLETFSQLFYLPDDEAELYINKTWISDGPRYRHRGLLLDSARHFLSLGSLTRTLDAMAVNKMNVLHWHLVDDQSFPYQSRKFPELSERGAYHPSMVYSREDIEGIINYARDRGIRVVPELDVPGHTRSWGASHPEILTQCYKGGQVSGLGPLDPTREDTYRLLRDLVGELQGLFPDTYIHVGGDEVDLACWESNPSLQAYMRAHNLTSATELHALFMRSFLPLLGRRSQPIVWQEVFDEGVALSEDTFIHVWKGAELFEMITILRAGHKVLFSSAWYLDQLKSGGDWEDFYRADPRQMVGGAAPDLDLARIVGGEACMWGEVVDDNNLISRVWPRASAVAERLWSPAGGGDVIAPETYARLEEHACRMNRRGVRAQPPSGPGYCLGAA